MKRLLTLVAFFATLHASAQQVNPVPDYVFRNQMSVGRGTVTDTAAYFSIGPRYGAVKGFMPPIVVDTASFSGSKRNGLLIFSVQKNKFLYWDSVRVQWSDMAGSSGSYITGSGILGYLPQFSGTTTLDTSALYTLGSRLGIGTTTFAYNSTNTANIELNNTAGGIIGFKRNDSARGYLWHTGDAMELANTSAGAISFNTNSATRGSISSAGVWRLHNLAGTGDRVVVASSNGTLSAASSATGLVDTLIISTRAWRQKGLDSLAALEVSGSGTTNYVPKFTASSTIGNSQIFDNGTNVGIGTASPSAKLQIGNGSGLHQGYISGGGYDLVLGASGGSFLGVASQGITTIFNTSATPLGIGTNGSQPLLFGTANLERLRITSAGNVGIGTTSPASTLTTLGVIEGTNGSIRTVISYTGSGGVVGTLSNHPLQLFANTSEAMRIFANGRVGVNTTTDAGYQFDVNGTLRASGGSALSTSVFSNTGFDGGIDVANTGTLAANRTAQVRLFNGSTSFGANDRTYQIVNIGESSTAAALLFQYWNGSTYSERFRINSTGNVGIGTASPGVKLDIGTTADQTLGVKSSTSNYLFAGTYQNYAIFAVNRNPSNGVFTDVNKATADIAIGGLANDGLIIFNTTATNNSTATERMRLTSSGELLINTTTDAGDYKLQVVGNARVGTGKLDIASNTTFGIGVARSGTSEVAGQIYNSSGILYLGAESSAGGQIFTGSSAYAAVIGSGANYPLQFATNNATRATINTNGELLINTTTDNGDFKLQVNGNGLISGSIKTANGTSSTAASWHLGSVVATNVQLDTANYVEVEINGTFYRLAIVTPL